MEAPAKGCIAGLISWKVGGGCLTTLLVFALVYALLGNC